MDYPDYYYSIEKYTFAMVKYKEQTWPNDYKLILNWISYLWESRHKKEKDVSGHDKREFFAWTVS